MLSELNLPEVTEQVEAIDTPHPFGSSGESQAHKALKEFVRQHPEVVGATSDWKSFWEYPLPSLDTIDVVFMSATACISVEVKSKISDAYPLDYERGIYQTIKYDAILKAMAKCGRDIPSDIRSVLVLQSTLPKHLIELAKRLGVKVFENIGN